MALTPTGSRSGLRARAELVPADKNGSVYDVAVLCSPGFEDIVAEAAVRELPKCVESLRTNGLVRVRTDASVQQLRAFPCATNVFTVIADVPRAGIDGEADNLRARLSGTLPPSEFAGGGRVRLRIHDDGQFAPITGRATLALEAALGSWSQQRETGRGAPSEVWLIRRSGMRSSLLATRLSPGRPRFKRGQLRPEVCAALARVEPLSGTQLVLDPFAGSGAIGDACLEAGAKFVWLNDLEAPARRSERPAVKWTSTDFRRLRVRTDSVDVIVTDPPWDRNWKIKRGAGHLYGDFGIATRAWLRPGGALVLLTGAPDAAVELLLEAGRLRSELVLPVLVNGSRAKVIRARKGRRGRRG